MALFARKTASLAEANLLLKGGIIGGSDLRKPKEGFYVNGLSMSFNGGAESVVFGPGGVQQPVSLSSILEQLDAGLADRQVQLIDGRLGFIDVDFSAAVTLDAISTAATVLGFTDAALAGNLYNTPGGAPPALVSLSAGFLGDNTYLFITDE